MVSDGLYKAGLGSLMLSWLANSAANPWLLKAQDAEHSWQGPSCPPFEKEAEEGLQSGSMGLSKFANKEGACHWGNFPSRFLAKAEGSPTL